MDERVTFCRICEPLCGMVATVENGKLTQLRPDRDHPLSQGYACPKGIAMADVQNDPDRVVYPLKRTGGPGEFERVTWEEAMSDIAARMRAIIAKHGSESVGWYMGNPGAFSYSHTLWAKGFLDGLGSPHYYSAGSQDVNNRFAASALLYGSPLLVPIPDLNRTDFLFVVGANPLVSHGSVLSAPRVREGLNAVVDRGGRVVVVDPRRSETARQFEHVAIRPGHRRLAAAVDAARGVRGEPRGPRRASNSQTSGADALAEHARALRPRAHRGGHRRAGRDRARGRARLRRPRRARLPTGAPARASAASARWSPICSMR